MAKDTPVEPREDFTLREKVWFEAWKTAVNNRCPHPYVTAAECLERFGRLFKVEE